MDVSAPPASCTKRSAAARSQSWLLPPAKAMSQAPWATWARRSASERSRGIEVNGGMTAPSRSSRPRGPATRAPASSAPGGRRDRDAVACGAAIGAGGEELLGDRRVKAGHHRPAVGDQRCRHRPIRQARDIGAGAVDRIDDPDIAGGKPRRIVDAFFRQPGDAVVAGGKPRAQEIIDRDVGFRDRRFCRPLGPVFQRRAEHRCASTPASRTAASSCAEICDRSSTLVSRF